MREIRSRLFFGTTGAGVITFACLSDGGYIILRGDERLGTWEACELGTCFETYLRMIDRPLRVLPARETVNTGLPAGSTPRR